MIHPCSRCNINVKKGNNKKNNNKNTNNNESMDNSAASKECWIYLNDI